MAFRKLESFCLCWSLITQIHAPVRTLSSSNFCTKQNFESLHQRKSKTYRKNIVLVTSKYEKYASSPKPPHTTSCHCLLSRQFPIEFMISQASCTSLRSKSDSFDCDVDMNARNYELWLRNLSDIQTLRFGMSNAVGFLIESLHPFFRYGR